MKEDWKASKGARELKSWPKSLKSYGRWPPWTRLRHFPKSGHSHVCVGWGYGRLTLIISRLKAGCSKKTLLWVSRTKAASKILRFVSCCVHKSLAWPRAFAVILHGIFVKSETRSCCSSSSSRRSFEAISVLNLTPFPPPPSKKKEGYMGTYAGVKSLKPGRGGHVLTSCFPW